MSKLKLIEDLKKQAKGLRKQVCTGDDAALVRVRKVYPDEHDSTVLPLMKAQHVVAVEHGFKKWADLLMRSEEELRAAIQAGRANTALPESFVLARTTERERLAPPMAAANHAAPQPPSAVIVLDWRGFLARLGSDELRCLRQVFDPDHGPLNAVWADVWDVKLVQAATALGVVMSTNRASTLLADLHAFGVVRRNAHSTNKSSPSYTLTDCYAASYRAVGNWFDLGSAAPTEEQAEVVRALQAIGANLARFTVSAAQMNASQRITARARLMGEIIGAKGRHPKYEALFEKLREEHNRHCPVEARVRVLRAADEAQA